MRRRFISLLLVLGLLLSAGVATTAEEALPAQDFVPEELPGDGASPLPEAEEASVAAEFAAQCPPEQEEPASLPALGSAGVAYAGVHYLSRAAYGSLNAELRAAYGRTVDEVTRMLDAGVPLRNVVFARDREGTLHFRCSLTLATDAPGGAALPARELVAPPGLPAQGTQAGEAAPAEPSAGEDDAPPSGEENMELIAQYAPVAAAEPGPSVTESMALLAGKSQIRELDTLFWENKNYFGRQLSGNARTFYDALVSRLVKGNAADCTVSVSGEPGIAQICNAFSALMLSYPQRFDRAQSNMISLGWSSRGGSYSVYLGIPQSKYYSAALEKQAKAKVRELVDAAYAYAAEAYPAHIPYGIVRYLDEWLCNHNYYNERGAYGNPYSKLFYFCHTAYGVLLRGSGVCESYAKAMSRLLDAAGIPNLYAMGNSHAWNYVQLPDGAYYLQDSTWDDPLGNGDGNTTREYLLVAGDAAHDTHEPVFAVEGIRTKIFEFPAISASDYAPGASAESAFGLAQHRYYLARGKTVQLKVSNSYYDRFRKEWSSLDPGIAGVGAGGKVTGVAPGETSIRMDFAGMSDTASVRVYRLDKLRFDNGKTTRSVTLSRDEGAQGFSLDVGQKGRDVVTAEELWENAGLTLKVSSDRKGIATAEATLTGDTITLTVTPHKKGTARITVKFGGKTATLTVRVKK